MKALLDTCTFLWLTADPARLGPAAAAALDAVDRQLYLSDVSVWELGLKWRAGKIRLPQPPRYWIEEQRELWRLQGVAIRAEHLYRETELPGHHSDPFDRLLVAQAMAENLVLVTPDSAIRRYPVPTIW